MELDSELRHHLLMAVNEAVNNVMKHSGAEEAGLSLEWIDGWLRVIVEDAGKGYDAAAATPGRCGLGNLTRRMESLGGRFSITGAPGQGTRVVLEVPLTR
jgi:signal transduction histidine kinase